MPQRAGRSKTDAGRTEVIWLCDGVWCDTKRYCMSFATALSEQCSEIASLDPAVLALRRQVATVEQVRRMYVVGRSNKSSLHKYIPLHAVCLIY
jgi:hypothetical protein